MLKNSDAEQKIQKEVIFLQFVTQRLPSESQ